MIRMPVSAFEHLRLEPVIAYRGPVPDWAYDLQLANPYYTFWLVERGGVTVEWSAGRRVVPTGRAILIPPGLRRRHRFLPETRLVSISFRACWADGRVLVQLDGPVGAGPDTLRRMRPAALRVTAATRQEAVLTRLGEFSPGEWLVFCAALQGFVAEVLAWVVPRKGRLSLLRTGDARLDRVLADLASGLSAGPLPMARWTDLSGLSRVQLDRLARRWLGESLRHRRDELLLGEIRVALARGRESLKELAARLGFVDASHFTRWVKTRTGRRPRDLRETWI